MSAIRLALELLLAAPDVTAIVADRVYPIRAPQDAARPFLILSRIGEEEDQILEGAGGVYTAIVSVACHAERSFSDADALGEKVKAALGNLTNRSVYSADSPATRLGIVTSWKAGADVSDHSDDGRVFRRIIDFDFRWQL
jgi:hypothetical protein